MLDQETSFRCPDANPAVTGYRLTGSVPGGVFLHGFRSHCDGAKARALARHAARRRRAWLRFDQRHCGRDDPRFARFTITRAIDDAVAVLDLLRQPAVLVGSSLGALIALHAADRRPALVRGLLLLAPAVRFVERVFAGLAAEEVEAWRTGGTRRFADRFEGGHFHLDYGFYRDAMAYLHPRPWKFACPVAILHGDQDELLPARDSVQLKGSIQAPAVSLEIIEGGDHRLSTAIGPMCRALDQLWSIE